MEHLNGDMVLGLGFLFWLGVFLSKSSTYFFLHLFLKMFKYKWFHVKFSTCLRKGMCYLRTQAPSFHTLKQNSVLPA